MSRLWLCFLLLGTWCRADVILSIQPSSQTVTLGSQASVGIHISGLGNGILLGTYDVSLGFDPALFSYSSISFGNQLDLSGLGDVQNVSPGTGTVDIFELSLDPASELNSFQGPAFTLATLTFQTTSTGANSPISLTLNVLGDAFGNSISANIENGSISINSPTTVPEAKELTALGLLLGVLLLRYRWRAKTE